MNRRLFTILLVVFSVTIVMGYLVYVFIKPDIDADQSILKKDYIVFSKPTFDQVYLNTEPEQSEIISEAGLRTYAAQGEIEPLTFSIKSNQDLGKVDLEISNLIYQKNKISKNLIEVFNVKDQIKCLAGPACYREDANIKSVPFLLVKDKQQDLIKAEPGFNKEDNYYYPPELNDNFNVIVRENQTHTFYLRIRVPENIDPGDYQGSITIKPEKNDIEKINLNLKVLPFSLPDSSRENLIYFKKHYWGPNNSFKVTEEQYDKYLDLLIESGITGFYTSIGRTLEQTEELAKLWQSKGFKGRMIVDNPGINKGLFSDNNYEPTQAEIDKVVQRANIMKKHGFDPYFYTHDEPSSAKAMKINLRFSKFMKENNLKVTTAITKECASAILDDEYSCYIDPDEPCYVGFSEAQPLDLPILFSSRNNYSWGECGGVAIDDKWLPLFTDYANSLAAGDVERNNLNEFIYNQLWSSSPTGARINFGLRVWAFDFNGAIPYGFQSYVTFSDQPNQDGIYRFHGPSVYDETDSRLREYSTVYPSTKGPVNTLVWEGYRKGIDDVRYMTKLENLIDRLGDNNLAKKEELESNLAQLRLDYDYNQTPAEPQKTKDWLAEEIVSLLSTFDELAKEDDFSNYDTEPNDEIDGRSSSKEEDDKNEFDSGKDEANQDENKLIKDTSLANSEKALSHINKEEFPSFKELIKTGPDAQTEDQQSETSNLIYFYIALGLAVFLIGVVLIRKKLLSRSSS